MLLKVEKSNKLSINFRPNPFKVVQKTGTEVKVINEAGEEFRRNTAFVKKYNEQDNVSKLNGKENSSPEEVGQGKRFIPMKTGVSGDSLVPLQSLPEKGETGIQMQTANPLISQQSVRRSSQIIKKPVHFGDFVLLLTVLENNRIKFQDFPGFPGPIRTL